MVPLSLFLIFFPLVAIGEKPQQVHLSLTKSTTEMTVTWVTFNDTSGHWVEFRRAFFSSVTKVPATATKFTNSAGVTRYIHRATLSGLIPVYQAGTKGDLSLEYTFTQLPLNKPYRICVFGDLGVTNGQSMPHLIEEGMNKNYDLVIHVGDIAYDLFKDGGRIGDQYMNSMQPLIATVPYMVIAGNHEEEHGQNFSTYRNLFTMPDEGSGDNQFYSFDVGPIHFIGLSTEYYGYYYLYGMDSVFRQFEWLQKDLAEAQRNRASRPWIIVYQHRPFYCSNDNSKECNSFENRLVKDGFLNMPGLEKIFIENKIDIGFWGHEHSYERFYPRADNFNASGDPYKNPKGPTYIISGGAGCHSGYATFASPVPFSASRINDYGYSRMFVPNSTHIHFQQISVEKKGDVVDDIWISKDSGFASEKREGEEREEGCSCRCRRERIQRKWCATHGTCTAIGGGSTQPIHYEIFHNDNKCALLQLKVLNDYMGKCLGVQLLVSSIEQYPSISLFAFQVCPEGRGGRGRLSQTLD